MLSCFTNSYGRFGPEAAFRLLPDAGITHVELGIKNAGVPSFFRESPLLTDASTAADVDHVRRLLDDSRVSLSSCNITSGNPLEPLVVQRTMAKLELAAKLGVVLVVGGAGEAEASEERDRLWAHLREIGDAAAARGIVYCCETHPGACQNAERMREMLEAVDHPHIRLNFDTGNLFYYNQGVDLAESLKSVVSDVRHVHLKDTPGGYQQWHFVELGSGVVDFSLVKRLLDDVGYDGPCSLEIEGIQGEPDLTLDQHHVRVKASVAHLRRCGYDV